MFDALSAASEDIGGETGVCALRARRRTRSAIRYIVMARAVTQLLTVYFISLQPVAVRAAS